MGKICADNYRSIELLPYRREQTANDCRGAYKGGFYYYEWQSHIIQKAKV